MKQMIPALITIFLVSCGNVKKEKPHPLPDNDSTAVQTDSQRLQGIWRKREENERADSIRMAGVLQKALDSAYRNIQSPTFKKSFTLVPDGLYPVEIKLAYNNFFSKDLKHLIVHMSQPSNEHVEVPGEYINIYVKHNSGFKQVLVHKEWSNTYTNDTLQDVNGDGLQDVVINGYGSNGCCLKAFAEVYLYLPQTGTFSEMFDFINPTFSGKEKVVRGVAYGHLGETEMYKYKWNGTGLDTLEYISFEKDEKDKRTGKIIRSIVQNNNKEATIKQRLNQVPAEYRHIYGYNWFLGIL
ncbi:hypothetical protein [Niastella sp. OAS944]|uniref:XAC2610-related protein n=1 Tax=Niastella sp. OAS944 TaxID=2664089 RepID=UPI00349B2B59|nr:hypothetical protein [Chitinophagaceae bacterium OAS944]